MTAFYFGVASFILAAVAPGLLRVLRHPEASEQLMAAQLIGSGGVAVLLLLAAATQTASVIDAALMLAMLAVFATAGFVSCSREAGRGDGDEHGS